MLIARVNTHQKRRTLVQKILLNGDLAHLNLYANMHKFWTFRIALRALTYNFPFFSMKKAAIARAFCDFITSASELLSSSRFWREFTFVCISVRFAIGEAKQLTSNFSKKFDFSCGSRKPSILRRAYDTQLLFAGDVTLPLRSIFTLFATQRSPQISWKRSLQ